jgi:hypothetical protein
MLVVGVIVPSAIVTVTKYTLFTFHTERVCTLLQDGRPQSSHGKTHCSHVSVSSSQIP